MRDEVPGARPLPDLLPWEGGPLCSRLLPHELGVLFLERARLADMSTEDCVPDEIEASEAYLAVARRNRDLVWSILPGDRIWLTIDPQAHPEVKVGVASIVVVRGGKIISKEHVDVF